MRDVKLILKLSYDFINAFAVAVAVAAKIDHMEMYTVVTIVTVALALALCLFFRQIKRKRILQTHRKRINGILRGQYMNLVMPGCY